MNFRPSGTLKGIVFKQRLNNNDDDHRDNDDDDGDDDDTRTRETFAVL